MLRSIRIHQALFGLLCGMLLAGCGTTSRFSAREEVRITSSPTGAEVWIGARRVGTTPVEVPLNKQVPHEIRVEKDGYHPESHHIGSVDLEEQRFVSFGLLRDAGFYRTLEENELRFELVHRAIPRDPAQQTRRAVEDELDAQVELRKMNLLERLRLQKLVDELYAEP